MSDGESEHPLKISASRRKARTASPEGRGVATAGQVLRGNGWGGPSWAVHSGVGEPLKMKIQTGKETGFRQHSYKDDQSERTVSPLILQNSFEVALLEG